MISGLRDWVLQLTGAALLSAAVLAITPEGKVRRVVSLACGFAVIAALLSLGVDFDYTRFSSSLAWHRETAAQYAEDFSEENEKLTRLIIEERCAAYILDKGASLGISGLNAQVSAAWSESGYWYPYKASLSAQMVSDTQRDSLTFYIESELGISAEMQEWGTENEDKGT